MIDIDQDDPFCFYLIALERAHLKEPIWFEYHEVELVSPLLVDGDAGNGITVMESG